MAIDLSSNPDFAAAISVTYYYPALMTVAFLAALYAARIRGKVIFAVRVLGALVAALFLAHLNRMIDFWPAHRYFASGHMTMSLGMALSLGLLRPRTLSISLPLLIPFGVDLVVLRFHRPEDVLGAILIVVVVYGVVDRIWGLTPRLISRPSVRAEELIGAEKVVES